MKKVLYIDDEKDSRSLFNASFKNDYDLYLADSAKSGQAILEKENDISVVISDYQMPVTSGIELFENLAKKESKAICILLTGYKESDIAIDAINQGGIYKYMTKPYKKKEIKTVIENAHELYATENEKNALVRDVIDEQESKNNLIAENLHENIAQQLASLKFFLHQEDTSISDNLLKEIVSDVRSLTDQLTPRSLVDYGLSLGLEELLKKEGAIPIDLGIASDFPRLEKELEIHIFRIVQYFIKYLTENKLTGIQLVVRMQSPETIKLFVGFKLTKNNSRDTNFENKIKLLVPAYGGQFKVVKEKQLIMYHISYPNQPLPRTIN